MSDHPNAALVRKAHQAFKTGDMATAEQIFAEDIVWTVTGEGPASGVTKGFHNVMKNFGDIMEWTEGTYDAKPVDYLGGEGFAAAMAHVTATRPDGRRLDQDEIVVFKVEDNKLVTAQHMAYDEAGWNSFFA